MSGESRLAKATIDSIAHECLASRFRLLNRLVTGVYDQALRPHGLRISQMNVLVSVAARGPVRASEICQLLKLEKSTLSRDLNRLVERGWLDRTPKLAITAAGRKQIAACLPAWRKAQREARRVLTPALADATMQVVHKLWQSEDLLAAAGR
jgi:DNA-binding MarR family transcriptional regulator